MTLIGSRSLLRDEVAELGHGRGAWLAVLRGGLIGVLFLGLLYLAERITPIVAFSLQIVIYIQAGRWIVQAIENGRAGRPYAESFWRLILPAAAAIVASLLYVMVSSGGAIRDETFRVIPFAWTVPLALYLLLSGGRLIQLASKSLGMDRMLLIDHFRPERASLITTDVFGHLRHPVAAGMARLALVFALVDGSVYGLLLAVIFILGWQAWWQRTEEAALVEVHGEAYSRYADRVPAFLPRSGADELGLARYLARPDLFAAHKESSLASKATNGSAAAAAGVEQ